MILSKIKTYALLILLIITVALGIIVAIYSNITKKQKKEFEITMNNYKALQAENSIFAKQNRVYKMTIADLEYMSDSISITLKKYSKKN